MRHEALLSGTIDRPLALPSGLNKETQESVPVITSDTLMLFLADLEPYKYAQEIDFPTQVSLPYLKPVFEDVYANGQIGDVFNEMQKQSLMNFFTTIHGAEIPVPESLKKQDEMERSLAIMYDFDNEDYKVTNIIHGEHKQVNIFSEEMIEDLENGNLMLMHIHTHPSDFPFSVQDFYPMIVDIPDGNHQIRTTKSIAVLCPTIQFIALTSPQTPLLSKDAFIDYKNEKISILNGENDARMEQLTSRYSEILFRSQTFLYDEQNRVLPILLQYRDDFDTGIITEEEYKRLCESEIEKSKSFLTKQSQKYNRVLKMAQTMLHNYGRDHALNNLLRLYNELHIKIYASENMEDFELVPLEELVEEM